MYQLEKVTFNARGFACFSILDIEPCGSYRRDPWPPLPETPARERPESWFERYPHFGKIDVRSLAMLGWTDFESQSFRPPGLQLLSSRADHELPLTNPVLFGCLSAGECLMVFDTTIAYWLARDYRYIEPGLLSSLERYLLHWSRIQLCPCHWRRFHEIRWRTQRYSSCHPGLLQSPSACSQWCYSTSATPIFVDRTGRVEWSERCLERMH